MARPELESRAFWDALVPELAGPASPSPAPLVELSPETIKSASASLHRDGYLQLVPVFTEKELAPVRRGLERLEQAQIPPVFIYVYDRPWALFAQLSPLISHFLGDHYALLPNFWAWHLPLKPGASGWPPHRDCDAQTRFSGPDGEQTLMSLSLWLPLSAATLENGCMSVLPRSREQDAAGGNGHPLPCEAGSVLGWTQDLLHWSNPVGPGAQNRRMSLSLEFQSRAFEAMAEPLLDTHNPPPFEQRLGLVRQQFAKYQHMEPVAPLA